MKKFPVSLFFFFFSFLSLLQKERHLLLLFHLSLIKDSLSFMSFPFPPDKVVFSLLFLLSLRFSGLFLSPCPFDLSLCLSLALFFFFSFFFFARGAFCSSKLHPNSSILPSPRRLNRLAAHRPTVQPHQQPPPVELRLVQLRHGRLGLLRALEGDEAKPA